MQEQTGRSTIYLDQKGFLYFFVPVSCILADSLPNDDLKERPNSGIVLFVQPKKAKGEKDDDDESISMWEDRQEIQEL